MTDREILERAAEILTRLGEPGAASAIHWKAGTLPPDPPADTVEVRIAVAVAKNEDYEAAPFAFGIIDDETLAEARSRLLQHIEGDIIAEAILTAHIPLRKVPVVEAEVEAK